MKTKLKLLSALLLLSAINYPLSTARAQGTAFTYQGRLNDGANPANGNYDMQFYLRPATNGNLAIGTTNVIAPIPVSNGLFTVLLDFGSTPFAGAPRWLEIGVRSNGSVTAYTTLSQRQQLTPTPYAIFAGNASNVVSGSVVQSLNGLKDNVTLLPGTNVTITPSGNTLTIASAGVGGSGIWSVNGNNTYYNAGKVGVGTTGPSGELTVATADDTTPSTVNAFDTRHAVVGTPTSGLALSYSPTLGAGYITALSPLVSWRDLVLQANGLSFRPLGGSPALTISNNYSVAMGYLTTASGQYSTALGGGSTASGQSAFAAGASAHANADFSVALGYVNTASGSYSTISGGQNNQATAVNSTIGGGDDNVAGGIQSTIAGGAINQATDIYSTVGGGVYNNALAQASVVAGGRFNQVISSGDFSTIAGGEGNTVLTGATHATIGGGNHNLVDYHFNGGLGGNTVSDYSTISGGSSNRVLGIGAVVGGGYQNYAVDSAVVPGGAFNNAARSGSFAAGRNANVTHSGSFMWSDGTATANSTGNNRFEVQATGGANFNLGSANFNANGQFIVATGLGNEQAYMGGDGIGNDINMGSLNPSVTTVQLYNLGSAQYMNLYVKTIAITSDRNSKESFTPVSSQDTLAKVASLPISRWNYKGESGTPHIGPMAQDFYAAFGVGADDKHIATVDEEGVALAAIQGLNQKLEEQVKVNQAKDVEIQELRVQNNSLEKRLEALERALYSEK